MLSATPVNTSLRDLRNQIYLMTEKRRDAFQETLGIGDIQTIFGVAQREFKQWEKERDDKEKVDKAVLLQKLGADFLVLLDAVSIARSRAHVLRFYPKVAAEIGGFPHREKPEESASGDGQQGRAFLRRPARADRKLPAGGLHAFAISEGRVRTG